MIGSAPTGNGLRRWLELALIFVPMRYYPSQNRSNSADIVLAEWETLFNTDNANEASRPDLLSGWPARPPETLERLASEQGEVDWFRFWLQGHEGSDPRKHDQYKRWEHLRELRDADLKTTDKQVRLEFDR